jgi:hypothetical protein
MMNRFPEDDERLVAFLKEYRPVPPKARSNAESQLMELVTREPPPPARHSHQFFWIVSSAVTGSLLLAVGGYRWLNPSPQFANNPEELETFVVDSWSGAMGDSPVAVPAQRTAESEWYFLSEPEARYVVSGP